METESGRPCLTIRQPQKLFTSDRGSPGTYITSRDVPNTNAGPPRGPLCLPFVSLRLEQPRSPKGLKMIDYSDFLYFSRAEFTNPDAMDLQLLWRLDFARRIANIPFVITSSYRAHAQGTHAKGIAVDISCETAEKRLKMLKALLQVGFNRIGVYDLHIHVDTAKTLPPGIWWGISNSQKEDTSP